MLKCKFHIKLVLLDLRKWGVSMCCLSYHHPEMRKYVRLHTLIYCSSICVVVVVSMLHTKLGAVGRTVLSRSCSVR